MQIISLKLCAATTLAVVLLTGSALAGDLTVTVTGIADAKGEIACSLFNSEKGFPESDHGRRQWVAAKPGGVACHYSKLPAGTYAVAVFQDLKGSHKLETNLMGAPTEPTGVSNNVRPSFRAPEFSEAAFTLDALSDKTIAIELK